MRPTSPPLLPLLLHDVPHALATMLAQEGVPTAPFQPGRTNGTFVLFDSRSRRASPQVALRQQAIDLQDVRKSLLRAGLTNDPFVSETGTHRVAWQVGEWRPSEEVAAVDRREVREQVVAALRSEVTRRGGVWMRLGRFPRPFRTAANFRFDHDDYIAADFDRTLAAISGYEAMTTHFVCGATHEPYAAALRRLIGLDVGSHGYRHHTYRTRAENLANVERGIAVLRRCGIEPSGFAAPHGRYNAGLAASLRGHGVSHSSEFSLAYDDVPFLPQGSETLQVPIHPFCLGIALEAIAPHDSENETVRRQVVEATIEHFSATAATLHAARMPIFFYGHPDGRVGRYPELLVHVLASIASLPNVWRTTMTEFQRWWRARGAIQAEVVADGGGWQIEVERLPPGFPAALEVCDGDRTATVPLDRTRLRVNRGALRFVADEPYRVPRPERIASPFDLKAMLRRALDWERVTPIEEIDSAHVTGLMKKMLRRIRS
jgi:hypothetical protein